MQYLMGIAFGAVALIGYGLDNVALAFTSKKYGFIRTSLMFFLMITIMSAIPALFLFNPKSISAYGILLALVAGAVSFVAFLSFAKGFEVGNVSAVASIANGWSAITVILSVLLLNEHPGLQSIMDIVLIIIGVVLVSSGYKKIKRLSLGKIGKDTKYALITMTGWGVFYFLDAVLVGRMGWFDTFFLLNIITLAFVFAYGLFKKSKIAMPGRSGYAVIFLGSLANVVAGIAYNLGVSFNFAAIVAPVASAAVLLPVLFGIGYLKEKPKATQVLGMALILIGIIALSLQ
jgi:uncharacterized membrane protein